MSYYDSLSDLEVRDMIERRVEEAVAAERERCVKIMEACRADMRSRILSGSCEVYAVLDTYLAAIRQDEP